ncbi:MAG TPA: thioesterase family protein [Polyangia bacterium]|jgi:acyl-CoA thioesterase|nr:thioesterase family protein [Polyangia bacterium]
MAHQTTAPEGAALSIEDFTAATALERLAPGRFRLLVPDGWQQGRGAFGGLVLGVLARAMERCETESKRTLRSLTGEIAGPVLPGEAVIEVTEVRRGSGVSTWSAMLVQGGEALARATAVLGRSREVEHEWAPERPPELARPWGEVDVALVTPPLAPTFTRFMEYRITGPLPMSGTEPVAAGWVRFRRPPAVLGAAEIVALADAWWPATFTVERAPRPVATIAFTLQLMAPAAGLAGDRPLYHRARTVAAHEGFLVEFRELWTEDGALAALNQQTIVCIR